ncbi:MAG: hypothetical protein R3D59_00380 [Paracoccaceae bacterium]
MPLDPLPVMTPDRPELVALAAAFSDVPRPVPLVGRTGSYDYEESDAFDAIENWGEVTPETLFAGYEGLIIMGPETAHFVLPHLIRVICLHRRRNEAADNFLMFVKGLLVGPHRWDLVPRLTSGQRRALLDVLAAMDREFYSPSGSDLAGTVAEVFAAIPWAPDRSGSG